MGCHFPLQAIFLTKGSNLGLLHCRKMLYPLSYYVVGLKYITKSRDVLSWNPQQKISKEFTRIPLSSFYKWRNEGTGKFVDWVIPIKLVNTRIDLLLLLSWLVVVNVKVADILNLMPYFSAWLYYLPGCSVMSDCLRVRGLEPARLLCPWNFPGKNSGVGCHFLHHRDLPDPGIKPASLESPALAGRFFITEPTGNQLPTHSTLHDALSTCRQEFWPRHSVPREGF